MNYKKRKRMLFILLILALSINLNGVIVNANNAQNINLSSGKYQIITNDSYGSFTIVEGENVIFSSYPLETDDDENLKKVAANQIRSALRVKLVSKTENNIITVYSTSASVRQDGLKIFYKDNKTTFIFDFVEEKVEIPLTIEMKNNKIAAYVDTKNIKEKASYKVYEIAILPFMFGGQYQEEGSFILPDGSGAQMELNQQKGRVDAYSQKIYSEDYSLKKESNVIKTANIGFPVFAFIRPDVSSIAVITDGVADASVNAELSSGSDSYSFVCSNFILRDITKYQFADNRPDVDLFQETSIKLEKIGLEYIFLSGEKLTYVDAANAYRNYLIENYSLEKLSQKSFPFNLEVISATVKKDTFLGIPVNKELALTTFDETKTILEELLFNDIKDINLSLNGWSKETILDKPNKDINFSSKNGGKSEYKDLQKFCYDNNITIALEYELNRVLRGSSKLFRYYEFSKSYSKSSNSLPIFNLNINTINENAGRYYFIRDNLIIDYTNKFLEKSFKLGIKTLSINEINLYKDFSVQKSTLSNCLNEIKLSLENIKKANTKIISNQAYDFMLGNTKSIFNMQSGSSNHFVFNKSIPFFQIVLHGLVNYSIEPINKNPNSNEQFLKAVETGSSLSYTWIMEETSKLKNTYDDKYFYASYDAWEKEAVNNYKKIESFAIKTSNQYIVDHHEIEKDVFLTKYENGMMAIVNYNDYEVETTFGKVKAADYLLIEK